MKLGFQIFRLPDASNKGKARENPIDVKRTNYELVYYLGNERNASEIAVKRK